MATLIPKQKRNKKKKGVNCFFSFSFPLLPGSFGISFIVITLTLTSITKAMINL